MNGPCGVGVCVSVGEGEAVGVSVGVGVMVAVDVDVDVAVGVGVSVANNEMAGRSDPSNQKMITAAPITSSTAATAMILGAFCACCWRLR